MNNSKSDSLVTYLDKCLVCGGVIEKTIDDEQEAKRQVEDSFVGMEVVKIIIGHCIRCSIEIARKHNLI